MVRKEYYKSVERYFMLFFGNLISLGGGVAFGVEQGEPLPYSNCGRLGSTNSGGCFRYGRNGMTLFFMLLPLYSAFLIGITFAPLFSPSR